MHDLAFVIPEEDLVYGDTNTCFWLVGLRVMALLNKKNVIQLVNFKKSKYQEKL